jgi:Pyruvate/2-oxoacid:ferredoxin oxidoreductase gamma subunit
VSLDSVIAAIRAKFPPAIADKNIAAARTAFEIAREAKDPIDA